MPKNLNQERIVRLLLDAALAHRVRGNRIQARELLDEALEVSREENQNGWLAAVRASQGVLERSEGNYGKAVECLQEAMELRRDMDDRIGLARAMGDLAGVDLASGKPEQASNRLEEALGLATETQPGRTRAEILVHAAHVYSRLGDETRAHSFLREAEEIYEQLGDSLGLAEVRSQVTTLGVRRPNDLDEELARLERNRLLTALERENWNQSRAARLLGVTETRVRNLMRRHGLTPRNRRGRPRKSGGLEQNVA